MNYFNYFTEIEDAFIRRRGRTLLLSPVDWALIESWKTRGVPLHVALNGIARVFDARESSTRKRSIKTLFYCAEEVEAQFAEWLAGQIGSATSATTNGTHAKEAQQANDASATSDSTMKSSNEQLPFAPEAVAAHLANRLEALQRLSSESRHKVFNENLERVIMRLREIEKNWNAAAQHTTASTERLESALTELEELLDRGLRARLTSVEIAAHESAVATQLAAFRSQMQPDVYQTTLHNLLNKRLRESYHIPRLSLFYL